MEKRWVGCDPANFHAGRPAGLRPEIIVLHSARGTVFDAVRAYSIPASSRSAHYLVARDGAVTQHVQEGDTAFHAGLRVNPSASIVRARPTTNPNFYSIGIEHEGHPGAGPWPQPQVNASAALIGEIAARWRIPLDRMHVIAHDEVRASAGCPGPGCDIDRLLVLAGGVQGEKVLKIARPLTLTARANIRRSPDTTGGVLGVAQVGATFEATGITRGEPVGGNDWWYVDAAGRHLWAGATDQPLPGDADGDPLDDPGSTDEMELSHGSAGPAIAPVVAPTFAINRSLALPPKDYVAVATPKDLIVLHFTAGLTARSAYETWRNDPRRIATAYIVDSDGTVFEMFDPRYWASHLGIKGGPVHDKRSIGIEIANVGPLTPSADRSALTWWTGKTFCSLDATTDYCRQRYRGFEYYAAFPPAQVASVAALVRYLTERFAIPLRLPPADKRHEFDEAFFTSFRGIATHANFRKDKFDIGPAFEWEALV